MADSVDNNFYVSESLTVGSLEDKMYSQRTLSAPADRRIQEMERGTYNYGGLGNTDSPTMLVLTGIFFVDDGNATWIPFP